jgi:hypothetical protein
LHACEAIVDLGPSGHTALRPYKELPGLSHDIPVEPRTMYQYRLARCLRFPEVAVERRSGSLPLRVYASIFKFARVLVSTFRVLEKTDVTTHPCRSRRYVAKNVMHRAPLGRTCVRLPSLLLHTLPTVDACQSVYGRPVVLAVRANIYEVVFRLS